MQHFPNLTPKEIYSLSKSQHLGGIDGYHIEKKYFDPIKQIQQRLSVNKRKGEKSTKHITKRGNYLDDEAKVHGAVPGPGKYQKVQEWADEKSKVRIKYADKMTYVDEIIKKEKKEKKPAPGSYNVVKTLKEEEGEAKKLAAKKVNAPERISYLDEVQYEAIQTPGVGSYNPRRRATTEFTQSQSQTRLKPEDWKKKHLQLEKKKPPQAPDMASYHPTSGDSTLFQNSSKIKHNKNFLGRVERFKTSASGSGLHPAKYNVLQEWRGKDGKKKEKHGLEVLSKPSANVKSVYYH